MTLFLKVREAESTSVQFRIVLDLLAPSVDRSAETCLSSAEVSLTVAGGFAIDIDEGTLKVV